MCLKYPTKWAGNIDVDVIACNRRLTKMGQANRCLLKALVKNPVKESFDIIFMRNEKNCQNINCFFSFPIKTFFN